MSKRYNNDEDFDLIYNDIKRRVDKLFAARTQYFGHLIAFLAAMLFAWGFVIWFSSVPFSLLMLITCIWGMGIGIHTVNWIMFEMREKVLRSELEKAGYYDRETAKLKRDRMVQLSDDGEIIDFYGDEYDEYNQHAL